MTNENLKWKMENENQAELHHIDPLTYVSGTPAFEKRQSCLSNSPRLS